MKEVLYKKEYSYYSTALHKNSTEIDAKSLWSTSEKFPLFVCEKNSNDEEEFVKNFGNPLASVFRNKQMLLVEKYENKISLKFFINQKSRSVGKVWFKETKDLHYLTVNVESGDVYFGSLLNYNKKKKCQKRIQKNFFLNNPITSFRIKIKSYLSNFDPINVLDSFDAIRIFTSNMDGNFDITNSDFTKRIFKFYLEKKGYKYPNNFELFAPFFFGGKIRKKIKKNGYKLVDAFMDANGLKGDRIKKAIHECEEYLNLTVFHFAITIFPYDWVCQDSSFLVKIFNFNKTFGREINFNEIKPFLTKGELNKIFLVFKEVIYNNIDNHSFLDHLSLYLSLKNYGEINLKWNSKSKKDFVTEHLDWSDKLEYYKRGSYTRIYPSYMDEQISEVIKIGEIEYFPTLLKTSEEYNSESYFQSNCVKTYIGRASSIIVSLRVGSLESENRITCEYHTFRLNNKFPSLRRVQTRAKYNGEAIGFETPLEILDKRMEDIILDNRFKTVQIEKKCSNGVELHSDSKWDWDGFLTWTYKTHVDNSHNNFINWI